MSDYTVSNLGQINDAGGERELFLKQFAGETLAAFAERNIMLPLTTSRSITSGKSAQFPIIGTNSASYHTPGAEIKGGSIKHAERVVHIDDLLISSVFIARIEEAMNHYDVRGEYSRQSGFALANAMDKAIVRCIIAGSLDTATEINATGGLTLTHASGGLTANNVVNYIMEAAQALDERDVPQTERACILTPNAFYTVLQEANGSGIAGALTSVDFGQGADMTKGGTQTMFVAGIPCFMTTHIPTTDESTVASDNLLGNDSTAVSAGTGIIRNKPFDEAAGTSTTEGYSGIDFQNYYGAVFHKSAAATVKLLDLAVESDYQIQRQGTLMVAKMAVGSNYLRAESCVGLKSA